jgi:hypothetical protein
MKDMVDSRLEIKKEGKFSKINHGWFKKNESLNKYMSVPIFC